MFGCLILLIVVFLLGAFFGPRWRRRRF